MAVHKLYIEEFEENDYHIIAIHTSIEDYRLAYFLNRELSIRLSKNEFDIQSRTKEGKTAFTRFTFEDEKKVIMWDLVQNKNEVEGIEDESIQNLFSNTKNKFLSSAYLLPEYKKVDFFLKIENAVNEIDSSDIVSKISNISSISLVYTVDKDKIKSKNNLIF